MVELQICTKCNIEKPATLEFFHIRKSNNKLNTMCKICVNERNSKYRENNQDKIVAGRHKHYLNNKSSINKKNREYYYTHKEQSRANGRNWEKNNPDKVREHRRKMKKQRRDNDPLFKMKENLRCRYWIALTRKNFYKGAKFSEYIGCSLDELKQHLEKQFKPGMNWNNYTIDGWHIDHIVPLASAKTEEELIKLLHYSNLQPLWASENYKKKDKY
jgi:hypothetical protein